MAFLHLAQHQFAVALDHGEQVVEVMGDTTGQPAYCFHFLGLPKLLFQVAAFGNIFHDHLKANDFATIVGAGAPRGADTDDLSVLALPRNFSRGYFVGLAIFFHQIVAVGRISIDVGGEFQTQQLFFALIAQHLDQRLVHIFKTICQAGVVHPVDRALHQSAVTAFRFAQSFCVTLALYGAGHVLRDERQDVLFLFSIDGVFVVGL